MNLTEALTRFLIGGLVVSAFAMLGGLFKPTSFAGLFGAAPSVALATLALTISRNGKIYAGTECRSMIAGAASLCLYNLFVQSFTDHVQNVRAKCNAFSDTGVVSDSFRIMAVPVAVGMGDVG
jgi:hypothetical protein